MNDAEAADILGRCEAEATRCRARMDHWGELQELERKKLNRLLADIERLQAIASTTNDEAGFTPASQPSTPNDG